MMASLGNFEMMASFGNFGTLGEIRNDATHEITKSKNGAKAAFSIYCDGAVLKSSSQWQLKEF